MAERDFKGIWIPKEVWLDERLNALDKVILAEIDSLDMAERGCYASNKFIADFCQCSETKVSTAISRLIKFGYIYVQSFDGRQRELKSRLSNFERQTFKNEKADSQNLKESNTENKTVIKTDKKDIKKDFCQMIVVGFTPNKELQKALFDFIEMRKLIKKPIVTDRALHLLLKKLNGIAEDDETQIKVLEQSIMNNWQSVYPLKTDNNTVGANGIKIKPESERDHTLDGIL